MIAHGHYHVDHKVSLIAIAGIIGIGVAASVFASRGSTEPKPPAGS
jgi:hypothetical protein